jgi:hypothetical protein
MEPEKEIQEAIPTPKNASWGAIISIIVILAMIVIGAFYAWGKRVDEERVTTQPTSATINVQNQ